MKNSSSQKLSRFLLAATTSASLSVLPGSAQSGEKQVQNNGATTRSAATAGAATSGGTTAGDTMAGGTTSGGTAAVGTANSASNASTGSDAMGSEQTKQPKNTKRHDKKAANSSEPRSDKWDSFHKQGTDVGGHKNTDSGFDFQHGNEKL
jgi:hypothetical protein